MGLMKGHCRCWCWNPAPVNLDHCSLRGFLNQSSKSLWCQSSPQKHSHQKRRLGDSHIYLSKFSNKNIIFTKIHKPILGCSTTQKNTTKKWLRKFSVLEKNLGSSSESWNWITCGLPSKGSFNHRLDAMGFCRKLVWLMKGLGTWGGFGYIGSLGASRNKKMNMCYVDLWAFFQFHSDILKMI